MKHTLLITLAAAAILTSCSPSQPGGRSVTAPDGTQWQQMTVERLPDLNVSRANHRTVVFGEEILVLGGHTEGYKPLESAEYYADGAWHTVPMLYSHANGFAAQLTDGRILIGGGSPEDFGIGQSWGAEIYDPASHSFSPAGIMAHKRSLSSALTLADGSVIIAGNWMADDSWESWTPDGGFSDGSPLQPGWSCPYILPASKDDIIIFGPYNSHGDDMSGVVEHVGVVKDYVPLLEDWRVSHHYHFFPENLQIADYTYVVPAISASGNEAAIIKVASGEFSLLEMEKPLPVQDPDGKPIEWSHLQVDRPARLIWLQGFEPEEGRICFARIEYDATFDGGKATSTFFYADNPGDMPGGAAKLLPGERMVLAGGVAWEKGQIPIKVDYFKTYSTVFIFHTGPVENKVMHLLGLLTGALAAIGLMLAAMFISRRRKARQAAANVDEAGLTRNLMEQMSALIEEKELFRQKNLRINDVASELATNKTYISVLLNSMSGESFTSMITKYRVEYAQKLLREHPDMLVDEVADAAGFSSRTSFFRNFKAVTGMTPQEWRKGN